MGLTVKDDMLRLAKANDRFPRTTEATGDAVGCCVSWRAKVSFVMSSVIPTAHVGLGGLGKRIPVVMSVSLGIMAATVGAAVDKGTVPEEEL